MSCPRTMLWALVSIAACGGVPDIEPPRLLSHEESLRLQNVARGVEEGATRDSLAQRAAETARAIVADPAGADAVLKRMDTNRRNLDSTLFRIAADPDSTASYLDVLLEPAAP